MAVISMIKNNPDALSPISKAFIKACRNPKPNPHKDPPCKEVDLNVPVSDIEQEIIKMVGVFFIVIFLGLILVWLISRNIR